MIARRFANGAPFRPARPSPARPAGWCCRILFFCVLASRLPAATPPEVVVDFESAELGKPVPAWTEKEVVFALAAPPTRTKAIGRVVFFSHLATSRKAISNGMATEAIPVKATFPRGASAVTGVFWAATGCAARLQAFDKEGKILGEDSVPIVPARTSPADPVPFFELTVRAPGIAHVLISGPRPGEYLALDELRFVPEATP